MIQRSSDTDVQLFSALRGGKDDALDELFRRHYAELCRVSIRFVREAATAEDIVQEFFASLWNKRDHLPAISESVGAYLRRSVRNRSLNYLRDRKRIPLDDGELPETGIAPETGLEREELRQRIDRAVERLPERCRLIFVMSKFEELSHREIAEELDISTKTVENQMTRAYKFLRQWLAVIIGLLHGAVW